jgi:hypothetical protein
MSTSTTHLPLRRIAHELVPGIVLPGLVYFVVSRHAPVTGALAAASSVPASHTLGRLIRKKPPSLLGLCVLVVTAASIGLAVAFDSPMLMLVKGAVMSALMGLAFAVSAMVRRPLTRTLAISFSSDHAEGRRHLAERWGHPVALRVFCALSVGWGLLLLLSGAQQAAMAFTFSPGTVVALEPPVQFIATAMGITISIMYVRRLQRLHPELHLLPQRLS